MTRHTPTTRPSALNSTNCCTRTAPGTLVLATARRVAGAGVGVGVAMSAMTGRADEAGVEAQAGNAQSTTLPKPKPITSRRMRPPVAGESAGYRLSACGARSADGHTAPSSVMGASRAPANSHSGPDSSATGRADYAIGPSWAWRLNFRQQRPRHPGHTCDEYAQDNRPGGGERRAHDEGGQEGQHARTEPDQRGMEPLGGWLRDRHSLGSGCES